MKNYQNNNEKIIHVLSDEDDAPKMDLVKTSEIIANMPVYYDEITAKPEKEIDFIITNVTPQKEVVSEQVEEDLGENLLFDLPLNSYTEVTSEKEIKHELVEDSKININDIEVFGAEEIKFEKETTKRYVLEDFDAQPTIGKSSAFSNTEKVQEEEGLNFELKTKMPQAEINEIETESEEISPLSLNISELRKRSEERKLKMKGFNYKFNDQLNKNIDEIERQPAYKRLGVDLDKNAVSSKTETAIKKESDDLGLKSNNSFLHDNVD